jgi:hypothetical protein
LRSSLFNGPLARPRSKASPFSHRCFSEERRRLKVQGARDTRDPSGSTDPSVSQPKAILVFSRRSRRIEISRARWVPACFAGPRRPDHWWPPLVDDVEAFAPHHLNEPGSPGTGPWRLGPPSFRRLRSHRPLGPSHPAPRQFAADAPWMERDEGNVACACRLRLCITDVFCLQVRDFATRKIMHACAP